MKLKYFYYGLYTLVMGIMLLSAFYCGNALWKNQSLPSFFYDLSAWISVDEYFSSTTAVQGDNVEVRNGYYYPQGNIVSSIFDGVVKENEKELILISDKGIKVIYHFKADVKKGERIRRHDKIGTSSLPIAISFYLADEEVSYENALQY